MAAEGEKEGDARRRGEPPELRHAPPCRRAARSTSAAAAAPASARLEKGRARAAGGGAPSRPRSPAERFAAASALDSPPPVGLPSDSPFASSSMALSWPDLRPPGRGVAGGGEGLHEVGKAAGTPNMGGGRPPERLANARGGRRRVAGDSSGDDTVAASVATLLAPLRFAGAAGLLWGGGGGGSGRRWRIRPRP